MPRLTKSFIEGVVPPEQGQAIYADDGQPGLALRVTPGSKVFVFQRRFRGRSLRMTIGAFPTWSVEAARTRARELSQLIDRGIDPRAHLRTTEEACKTLAEVFEAFIAARQLKARTASDYRRYFNVYIGGTWEQRARRKSDREQQKAKTHRSWHSLPITAIDAGMVAKRHLDIARSSAGPSQANACMRMLRSLFTWARADLGKSVLPENPVSVITEKRQWHRERPRQVFIRREQLAPWFAAVGDVETSGKSEDRPVISAFLQFVLLTGARRGEAEPLRWADVDFSTRTITFRDTKNGDDRTIPMTNYVSGVLRGLQGRVQEEARNAGASGSPFVFATSRGRTGHLQEPRKALAAVSKACGVKHTVHDLRRTYATHFEGLDVSVYALKRLLGHSDGADVTARHYAVRDIERLRGPAQRLEDYILESAGIALPGASALRLVA